MDGLSHLPRVEEEHLRVWDASRNLCCGYLNKKAGRSTSLSKGKWQKRWFAVRTSVSGHENYTVSYFHSPEDKSPRQTYNLDGASVIVAGGANTSHCFDLICSDGTHVSLSADSRDTMEKWVATLQYVAEVAAARGKVQRGRWGAINNESPRGESSRASTLAATSSHFNPFRVYARLPSLRLDLDVATIPPGSLQRNQFEEKFTADIASALSIDRDVVRVYGVQPAPGAAWLAEVQFDLELTVDNEAEERERLLHLLKDFVSDRSSPLHRGAVTCTVDPNYTLTLASSDQPSREDDRLPYISADPAIQKILQKYQDVQVPQDVIDVTHFSIRLNCDQREVTISVPNPLILRKKHCLLWAHDVKKAIGYMGNMQELWVDPIALVPRGLPKAYSDPIPFKASPAHDGAMVIHASKLKADLAYDVLCEDHRDDVLQMLTSEEQEEIEALFRQYDVNGDGKISRRELEDMIRERTAERKSVIDTKIQDFLQENASADAISRAEEFKRVNYQHLTEAQAKLIKMFEMADIDGDGTVSHAEFLLAEAWWMRCALNPENVNLF